MPLPSSKSFGLFWITALLLVVNLSGVYGQDSAPKARVAILPFANQSADQSIGWMKTSIPTAVDKQMRNMFRYAPVDGDYAEEVGSDILDYENNYSDDSVRDASEDLSADYVIYGHYSFSKNKKTVRLTGFIYHAGDDKVIGTVDEISTAGPQLFKATGRIAGKITKAIESHVRLTRKQNLANSKKPLPPKTSTATKAGQSDKEKLFLAGSYSYLQSIMRGPTKLTVGLAGVLPAGAARSRFSPGLGLRLELAQAFWSSRLHVLAQTGLWRTGGDSAFGVDSLVAAQTQAGVGYSYRLFKSLSIMPYLSTGIHFGQISADSEQGFTDVSFEGGVRLDYRFSRRLWFTSALATTYLVETDTPFIFDLFYLGTTWSL